MQFVIASPGVTQLLCALLQFHNERAGLRGHRARAPGAVPVDIAENRRGCGHARRHRAERLPGAAQVLADGQRFQEACPVGGSEAADAHQPTNLCHSGVQGKAPHFPVLQPLVRD